MGGEIHGPRAGTGHDGGVVTVTLPLASLGPIAVTAPPPALVSPDVGAEHVGCTRAALAEHLGWMARDPRWRERVIVASRKRRLAAPANVVESMRERYATRPAVDAAPADEEDDAQAQLERDLGIVDAPAPRRAGRRGAR